MIKRVSAYEARTKLGELINLVYYQGMEIVVERMGKPMAKLIPIDKASNKQPQQLLDLAGAWDNKDGQIIKQTAKRMRAKSKLIA